MILGLNSLRYRDDGEHLKPGAVHRSFASVDGAG